MSNISENRINVVIAPEDITFINTSVTTILSKIPANTTLDDEQRVKFNAIDVTNKVYAEDCLMEGQTNGTGILNTYINLNFLQNDLTVYDQLDQIESAVLNLLQRVKDAKRIAGHEAYGMSNAIYKAFKNANEDGIPNAKAPYDRLKVRYEAQTNINNNAGRPSETEV